MEADTAWSAPTNLTYATALLCPAAPAQPRLLLSRQAAGAAAQRSEFNASVRQLLSLS